MVLCTTFRSTQASYTFKSLYKARSLHRLEALARQLFPEQAAVCHNLLRHKSVIIQPELLEANGITVHRLVFRLVENDST